MGRPSGRGLRVFKVVGTTPSYVRTGFGPIDHSHREVDRRILALASAVQATDEREARRRLGELTEELARHFADEEAMMGVRRWTPLARHAESHLNILRQLDRFDRMVRKQGLTEGLSSWAVRGLPDLLRYHTLRSDFGFAKFALGVARNPGAR